MSDHQTAPTLNRTGSAEPHAPTNVAQSFALVVVDLASTIIFMAIVLATHRITLAIGCGIIFGAGQIVWSRLRGRHIDLMQWMSLGLVLVSGASALLLNDPRIVMAKPSVVYAVIGAMMLRPGWMTRYLPAAALRNQALVAAAAVFGYGWAGLMFLTAAVNIVLALNLDPVTWAAAFSIFALVSKLVLFAVQYAVMRSIAVRGRRAASTV